MITVTPFWSVNVFNYMYEFENIHLSSYNWGTLLAKIYYLKNAFGFNMLFCLGYCIYIEWNASVIFLSYNKFFWVYCQIYLEIVEWVWRISCFLLPAIVGMSFFFENLIELSYFPDSIFIVKTSTIFHSLGNNLSFSLSHCNILSFYLIFCGFIKTFLCSYVWIFKTVLQMLHWIS